MLQEIKTETFFAHKKLIKYRNRNNRIFPSSLQGLCAIGSVGLFDYLKHGLKVEEIKLIVAFKNISSAHCWLKYNEYVIDITASQFYSVRNAYIVDSESNIPYLDEFSERYEFRTMNNIIRYFFKESNWEAEQMPFTRTKKTKFHV